MKHPDTLYVQMFESFQLSYGKKPLMGGTRRDTYFSSLMQILLHNARTGVSRDYLEDVLLGDRDIENPLVSSSCRQFSFTFFTILSVFSTLLLQNSG